MTVLTATLNPRVGRPNGVSAAEVTSAGAGARASWPWAAATQSYGRGRVEIARVSVGQTKLDRFVDAQRRAFLADHRHRPHKLWRRSIKLASRISLGVSTSLADTEAAATLSAAAFWGRAPPA